MGGLALIVLGTLVICQVTFGQALDRVGLIDAVTGAS